MRRHSLDRLRANQSIGVKGHTVRHAAAFPRRRGRSGGKPEFVNINSHDLHRSNAFFSLYSVISNVLYTDGFAYDNTIPFTTQSFPVGGLKDITCRNPQMPLQDPDPRTPLQELPAVEEPAEDPLGVTPQGRDASRRDWTRRTDANKGMPCDQVQVHETNTTPSHDPPFDSHTRRVQMRAVTLGDRPGGNQEAPGQRSHQNSRTLRGQVKQDGRPHRWQR